MPGKILTLCLTLFYSCLFSAAQKTPTNINIDSLPHSEIDIPIQIDLRPFYALAEKKVDTAFTSPNYPNGWIQPDCGTRYKYHFRRSPLRISMSGTTLNLGFMGYYQIVGSTRLCAGSTVLSPWAPSCTCGFSEAERRVTIGFTSTFRLQPNFMLITKNTRNEPQPLDKCSVCFWGQDITTSVMNGLKADLDASKKQMDDSFGVINLRPYLQQAWNKLSEVYILPAIGYFSLHPQRLRMENINAKNDMLNLNIGITATPLVTYTKPDDQQTPVPDLTAANHPGGFNVFLEAALQYDSLGAILNGYLVNKRFDFNQGIFKNHIIIEHTAVSGDDKGHLLISVQFSGSFNGNVTFTGIPVYNADKKSIDVSDLHYDLETSNLLLKTAKWLFSDKIVDELKKYTSFEMTSYYDTASKALNNWLNREWTKGISGNGSISELKLVAVHALPEHLLIRSNCVGKLNIIISKIDLNF